MKALARICCIAGWVATLAFAGDLNGHVRFLKRQDPSFDKYTNAPGLLQQRWMSDHFFRMMVYAPYFDARTSWYGGPLVYLNTYGIQKRSSVVRDHPDWVLKRPGTADDLYIPYDCGGTDGCPQYAADISNQSYRRTWIDHARDLLSHGYVGVWVDDVNMQYNVSDSRGSLIPPLDPNSGRTMTWSDWRRYMAEFMEQIRKELPDVELLHNSIWYAGPDGIRDKDPYILRQIQAADYINIERGVNDSGIKGGTGDWSLSALFAYIDRIHSNGKAVVIDDFALDPAGREYALAAYFLITNGDDCIGNQSMTPDNWWAGYDVDLGRSLAPRTVWNSLLRRDFDQGMVLLNEPGAPTRTVTLPRPYSDLRGTLVTSVTLDAKRGAVLLRDTTRQLKPKNTP